MITTVVTSFEQPVLNLNILLTTFCYDIRIEEYRCCCCPVQLNSLKNFFGENLPAQIASEGEESDHV